MNKEKVEFLRSGPNLSTPRPVRQTTIVTLQGVDLAMAELINIMEEGENNAIARQVELEVQGALNAL